MVTDALTEALADLRADLADPTRLVRAVASGRRRGLTPAVVKADLRPVDLKAGRVLQVVTSDGRTPTTRNLTAGAEADIEVDRLLAEPFGSWYVETVDRVVQLRVTKKGRPQVHVTRTSRRDVAVASHDRARRHLLDPADPLFAVLGADADKRRQVDAFLRLLAPSPRGSAPEPTTTAGRYGSSTSAAATPTSPPPPTDGWPTAAP